MEDDDEFGDLYTDVLRPFASPSSSAPHPHQSSPAPPSLDLNINLNAPQIPCDAPHANSPAPDQLPPHVPLQPSPSAEEPTPKIEPPPDSKLDAAAAGGGVEGVDPMDRDVKFDIEEEEEDGGGDPVIPGLSGAVVAEEGGGGGEGDDWDSDDSEDDLKIVLNENNHMAMERGGMGDGDEEEEDEDEGLVIVGGDPNQGAEEQEWGESSSLAGGDGERKDAAGELAKSGSGGATVAPKIGYSNHGYHPFHSQFKYQYVRPGAALMPGATTSAPGGPPGQIRPLANMAGRGRGDWRPPGIKGAGAMQKGFHAGPGLPGWGNSGAGRGFGGGLEFTLPSHKTIFDVDIESFEEKPWKYPNVDASDFFNFSLNEESWKDYCKQLEQLRLESTMQSKIRVYESGRTEQEYDPDLPPELAAATGIHEAAVENANYLKSDVGQSDVMKGSGTGRVRPPLPTGRAIQVEGGYGDRLPSIDTRPPRIRDSDAIIEIVLQDTEDDHSSAGNAQDPPEGGEPNREDFREDHVAGDEIRRLEPEYFDGFPQDYNGRKKELAGRGMPFINSSPANMPNGDEKLFFPQEERIEYSGSRGQNPRSYGGNISSSHEERKMQRRVHGQSPPITPIQELATDNNQKEESDESMEDRHGTLSSSPVIDDVRESSVEDKDTELEVTGTADGTSKLEKEEIADKVDTVEDGVAKRQKLTSQADQPLLDEVDDWEDSKAAKSSDNSKARSASSRDNQRRRETFEEEVVQNPRPAHLSNIRQHPDEIDQGFYRRDHDAKQEPERNRLILKGRERPYPYKDRHPSSAPQLHPNTDGFDAQKERDSSDMDWSRRDDDLYSRRVRNDEPRKGDRAKVRENDRNDKEDSLHSRKQLDNGSYRVSYDKDVGSRDARHRERDEGLRIRYEAVEDYHGKRRKDEEYLRREHIDKEEILHGYRENAGRRRRERDEILDPRKRDDLQRTRDNPDDQYPARQKDEAWILRERGDRQKDREEWHRMKQSHEEHLPKREREEGRSSVRSGRGAEEKAWVGHVRTKDEHKLSEKEYLSREAMRHNDQMKRRDRIQDESPHHKGRDDASVRGNQYEERRSRQERSSSRSDRVANASDSQKVKHREGSRKSKERDVSDLNSLGVSKRSQENQSGPTNEKGLKGSGEERAAEHEIPGHRLSRKQREDNSSDDEQQDSHRGRSKLERWTSHKERDFSINKSSSSLKFKDHKDNNDGSSEVGKPADEPAKTVEVDNQHLLSAEARDSADMENNRDGDTKEMGDRHLDTVERLKKRSERFKLPMPSEKEAVVIKKLESEPLPSAKSENLVDSEVKQERPARKRRWITN